MYDLYQKGVHVTGTLDCSRIGVPSEIYDLKKEYSKSKVIRGDGAYVRDGIKVFSVWRDTKCVCVMSSEHPGHSAKCVCVMSSEHPGHSETTVERNIKDKMFQFLQ